MHTQVIYAPAFQKPSGGLYLNSAQDNISSGVETLVNLDGIFSGFVDGIENVITHRIVVNRSGFYFVIGSISYKSPSVVADKVYECRVRLNGNVISCGALHSSNTTVITAKVQRLIYCLAGDYFDLAAFQVTGVNTVDLLDGYRYTHLFVQRVR